MSEKKIMETNEKTTSSRAPHENKQPKRYTPETEKIPPKLNEGEAGPRRSAEKSKDDNSNLPPTEGKPLA